MTSSRPFRTAYTRSSIDFRTVEAPQVQVGPHSFVAIGTLLHRKKCRACYRDPDQHGFGISWTPARPIGDKR